MLPIIHVCSLILPSIFPNMYSFAMHFIIHPLPLIMSTILPLVLTVTMQHVLLPSSWVEATVGPHINPFSVFLPIFEFSLVLTAVWPFFDPMPILLVVLPVALVNSPFATHINSKSICLISTPLAFITISVLIDYPALSFNDIGFPLSLKFTAIGKRLDACAFTFSLNPLAFISAARFKYYQGQLFLVLSLNFVTYEFEEGVVGGLLFLA